MVMNLKWETDTHIIKYTEYDYFCDVELDGITVPLHYYLAFNQDVMDAFNITQVRHWIQWWIKYRNEIHTALDGDHRWEYISESFSIWSNVSIRDWMNLDSDSSTLSAGLDGHLFSKPFEFKKKGWSYSGFILLLEEEQTNSNDTQKKEATVHSFGCRELRFSENSEVVSTSWPSVPEPWCQRMNYSYKMDSSKCNFFRSTKKDSPDEVMFGVELEVCSKLSPQEVQTIVMHVEPKQEPFFIFKEDSSINGMYSFKYELVTVPATPAYLKREFRLFFSKLESLARAKNLDIGFYFDTSRSLNNGLHVHVSRDKFWETGRHVQKFMAVFNEHGKTTQDFINRFTGRPILYSSNQYCRPAESFKGVTWASKMKMERGSTGRCAAHDRNSATIEVRIYQGIFDLDHVLRCIEFTQAIFYFCAEMSHRMFGLNFKRSFMDFLFSHPGYVNIKKELKECA